MSSLPGSWLARALVIVAAIAAINIEVRAEIPLPQFGFEDYLIAPVRIHLLTADDRPSLNTTLTEADIERIVTKVNDVWSQAGIRFHVESIVREAAAPFEGEGKTARSLNAFLSVIPPNSYGTDQFNVYFIKEFPVNGVYFPKAIFVKDTAALRPVPGGIDEPIPRVTSHELGHALGLPHRQDLTNLMASGTTGTSLNSSEIENARMKALSMSKFVRAPKLVTKADTFFDEGKKSEARELYRLLSELPLNEPSLTRVRERLEAATIP